MSDVCCFDYIPAELLYILFDYFSAHELLQTFLHISDYIDKILQSYSVYRLNFQSIRKCDFDLICRFIHPEQVISLILSDDNNTSGLPQLFLSHFRIQQFTRIRSLSINTESIKYIDNPLINAHLCHLKLEKCSDDELEIILQYLPQLKSLNIYLDVNRPKFTLNVFLNRLIRLSLQIYNYYVSMDDMEQFLKNLTNLKYFELRVTGLQDLFDGYRWKTLTKSFHTFNFQFFTEYLLTENILKSFAIPFWIEEKHWFVAYEDYSLFSIPHFAPKYIDISKQLCIHSTAPNNTFLYNYVNKIVIKTVSIKHKHYFRHIKTFELKCSVSLTTIRSILDLSSIKCLTIMSLDDVLKFIPLKNSMPYLHQLIIENDLTIDVIQRIHRFRFEQIHKLEISINPKQADRIIEKLSMMFPYLQNLIYKSPIHSKDTIIRLIQRFQHLTNVSFLIDIWFYRREINFCQTPSSIVQYLHYPAKDKLIRRVYGSRIVDSFNDRLQIHFWIEEESSTHLSLMYWLSNPGYCWYRFKSSIASTSYFYFLIRLLIFIFLVMIIIGSFQSINTFLNEVLYYMSKCNIYVMFVNILFFSVVFTFTLISLPIYDKIFH